MKLSAAEQKTLDGFHGSFPLNLLPKAVRPYGEISRLHRPAGVMMFYFPCFYGTFLVGILNSDISWYGMIIANAKLFLLMCMMRGVFVTYNDILDQDFDQQVARTRIRPLARGAISTNNAIIWTLIQSLMLAGTFVLLPRECATYSLPFLAFHTLYPLGKRLTHHPQLVLGLAFNQGTFIAFPALNKPLSLKHLDNDTVAAFTLSAAIFFWTMLYDSIYAAQDSEDDEKAGVGSPVTYWGESLKNFLRALGFLMMLCLVLLSTNIRRSATTATGGLVYDTVTCAGTSLSLFFMIQRVNLKDPANCGWWFNRGNVLVGYALGLGLVGEYLKGCL